jgi:hypothetical protein
MFNTNENNPFRAAKYIVTTWAKLTCAKTTDDEEDFEVIFIKEHIVKGVRVTKKHMVKTITENAK